MPNMYHGVPISNTLVDRSRKCPILYQVSQRIVITINLLLSKITWAYTVMRGNHLRQYHVRLMYYQELRVQYIHLYQCVRLIVFQVKRLVTSQIRGSNSVTQTSFCQPSRLHRADFRHRLKVNLLDLRVKITLMQWNQDVSLVTLRLMSNITC